MYNKKQMQGRKYTVNLNELYNCTSSWPNLKSLSMCCWSHETASLHTGETHYYIFAISKVLIILSLIAVKGIIRNFG